jgi:hypothetical protein
VEPNFHFLEGIAGGPESQIDPQMAAILKDLQGKPVEEVKQGIRKALDYGARYALASGFVMQALHIEWERLGGQKDDPTPWRDEMP